MSYPLQTYLALNLSDLELRYKNLMFLAETFIQQSNRLNRILTDPAYAREQVEWYRDELAGLREELDTVITAIDVKRA